MKKLLTIAALLISFQASAVDLSGFGINNVNPGYHFAAKVAVKGVITGKVQITKDILTCQALLEDYKQSVAALKNSDVKFKGTCAVNKTGKPIGWMQMIPVGFFNS
jgi:hypothetical protein